MSNRKFYNGLIVLSMIFLLCILAVGCGNESSGQFVSVEGTDFVLDGEVFRFAGTNNYYLNYKDEAMIDDVIMNAKDMNLKVIRIWGFLDGIEDSMKNNNAYMQTEPGVFDQIPEGARNGYDAIDYAIKRAGEEEIKLVIVLTNNWSAFGGMDQYVKWSDQATEHDDFYTDEQCKMMYKNAAEYLITRENPLTGVAYKDDPTIFAWELANEPRCESDPSGETVYNWALEMSQFVKELDDNHMVTLGDEGFFNRPEESSWAYNGYSGVDWERNLSIDTIDYGTFHLYPEHWGEDFEPVIQTGIDWINEHQDAAMSIGKPAVLEEYGIQAIGENNRDMVYELWTNEAHDLGLAGTMFWILTGIDTGDSADDDDLYTDYDGFRVVNDGGKTSMILSNHALEMSGNRIEEKEPGTYIISPYEGEKISEVFAFKTGTIAYNKEVEKIELQIEGVEEVIPCSIKGTVVLETYNYPIDGDTEFTVTVTFKDGTSVRDSVTAFVNNREMIEVESRIFTFDDDMEGFEQEATTQAKFGEGGVVHSEELGGTIKVDAIYEGQFDWQELRIVNRNVPEIADAIRLEYDLYYLESAIVTDGMVTPYAVGNPGWVKLGLFENELLVSEMSKEEIDGINYAVQHVVIEVLGTGACSELYVGINGATGLTYEGPIFLDNLVIYSEKYAD